MEFKLTEKQELQIKAWQEHIKEIYGEYGNYEYRFTPAGIGDGLYVYSKLAKIGKDFSNVEDW